MRDRMCKNKEDVRDREDLEALEAIEDRIDLDDAREALADAKKNGTVSWESLKRKLNL